MFKNVEKTAYRYCNNPALYLENAKNDAYGDALRNMSAEALNMHLDELNNVAQENYISGYDHGFRNGLLIGAGFATGIVGLTIGTIVTVKQVAKENKDKKIK